MTSQNGFDRSSERSNQEKLFAVSSERSAGASNADLMRRYPNYTDSWNIHENCNRYAHAYASTMLHRVL